MPVPVPIHNKSSTHRVIKAHSSFQGAIPPLAPEPSCDSASKYVIQQGCQPAAPQGGFPSHSHLLQAPSNWTSFSPFYSGDESRFTSRPGLTREGSDIGFGLASVGDTAISKHVHAEAFHSPRLLSVTRPSSMGLQHIAEQRLEDVPRIGCESETTDSAPRLDSVNLGRGKFLFTYGGDTSSSVSSHQRLDSDTREELCDSLLQPATTPFADFVDRIVATETIHGGDNVVRDTSVFLPPIGTPFCQRQPAPTEPLSNPSYIKTYRAMAEPLSEWMADYVWKVCTDGVGLPRRFVGMGSTRNHDKKPSCSLAKTIHSVLCSTLLQPSAIILALWYITRLPVIFEGQAIGVNLTPSELDFRTELYGEGWILSVPGERSQMEARAPFRIALLGCMLANKWLDDHTFSNKTWQSISDVPIQSINRLELAALAVLGHDLTITPKAWDMWLAQLHRFPAPICRPSLSNSHAIARKVIMELTQLHDHSGLESLSTNPVQPVFSALLVLDFDKRDEPCQTGSFDPFEIDLDEDGPLREEYVPRRRSTLKRDTHNRSASEETSECGFRRRPEVYSTATVPVPENVPLGYPLPYLRLQASSWDAQGGSNYNAASFMPQQTDLRSCQSNYGGFLSSFAYPIPAVWPPPTHSRTSSSCASSTTHCSGHMRSYSQIHISGNDVCSLAPASCSRYDGHSSVFFSGQHDACHLRPLWLKA